MLPSNEISWFRAHNYIYGFLKFIYLKRQTCFQLTETEVSVNGNSSRDKLKKYLGYSVNNIC